MIDQSILLIACLYNHNHHSTLINYTEQGGKFLLSKEQDLKSKDKGKNMGKISSKTLLLWVIPTGKKSSFISVVRA